METEDAWAQLVCTTDLETPPIPIMNDKFTIGRAKECDLSLSENKLVSGKHCYIEKKASGKVWLYDTSTNGTLLNMSSKVSKGNGKEMSHGDEFHIVYKKNNEELNVGYVFQLMSELEREEANNTQDYSSDSDVLEATFVDDEINTVSPVNRNKRPKDTEALDEPEPKKLKKESEPPDAKAEEPCEKGTAKKMEDTCEDQKPSSEQATTSGDKTVVTKSGGDQKPTPKDDIEETLTCTICQEIMHDCISLQPCMHTFCAGCYSDWMKLSQECPTCRMKVDRINKNHIVNNLIDAYLRENPEKKRPEEDIKDLDAKNKITRDMLYPKAKKAASDCSDSEDYEDSDEPDDPPPPGPTPLPHIPPAPAFGFGIPRPFGGYFGPPKTVCRQCPEYKEPVTTGIAAGFQTIFGAVKNVLGGGGDTGNQATTAGGTAPTATTAGGTCAGGDQPGTSGTNAAGPSTSGDDDVKVMPTPPPYVCFPAQVHVLCVCCLQAMPDRRGQRVVNPDIPPQQCTICYRAFCHAYWGCRKGDCVGCLGKFKELNFGKKCLNHIILDNPFESEIFKDYLESKGLTLKDVLKDCMTKLDSGKFTCVDQGKYRMNAYNNQVQVTSNTVLCYPCGLRNFKDLAYLYRSEIAKRDLPGEAASRPDCYWGKNCRTQRNKPHHAKNFSHICDQTRTHQ